MVLRVTVPLGMQLQHGTRLIIDQNPPSQQPFKICFPVGCMSDYPVTDDMIANMKKGQTITLQAINMQGKPISLPLPLADFAKAYDGPPTDPKLVEEQQRKLQSQLGRK
jgi:invasion protein IalB